MRLLSKISGNRTVGILQGKKESYSMRRGQHVGTGSWSFDKIREVGDLSYLGFTLYLSTL